MVLLQEDIGFHVKLPFSALPDWLKLEIFIKLKLDNY